MSGPGTRWSYGSALEGIEVSGSTAEYLRLCAIDPEWPYLQPPVWVPRKHCTLALSRVQRVGGAE